MPTVKANYKASIADPSTTRGYGWKIPLDSFRTTVDRKLIYKNQIILDY